MWRHISFYEKCLSLVESQFRPTGKEILVEEPIRPTITISRMAGAGGHTVASNLAGYLEVSTPRHTPWTLFDRDLMEKVMEDHHLSKRLAESAPEDHRSMITDTLEELLGLHPNSWTLVRQTAETILHIARMGNVIIVGRGGNVVTARMSTAFHVRLIGSLENRTRWVMNVHGLDERSAQEFIKMKDDGRKRYLKKNFEKDIDDPLLYHLIVDTDLVSHREAARLIGDEVIKRFRLDRPVRVAASLEHPVRESARTS